MSDPITSQQKVLEVEDAKVDQDAPSLEESASGCDSPAEEARSSIAVPLTLLIWDPHPLLVELQAAHGGVPLPVSPQHFAACIELCRSIYRLCSTSAPSVSNSNSASSAPSVAAIHSAPRAQPSSPAKPANPTVTGLSCATAPNISPPSGLPRRIVPVSEPSSQAKPLNSPSTSTGSSKSKKTRITLKSDCKKTTREIAALWLEEIFASTKHFGSIKPADPAALQESNAKVEDELRALRLRIEAAENEQKSQDSRVAELENTIDDATIMLVDIKERLEEVTTELDEATTCGRNLLDLEAKVATIGKDLAEHQTALVKIQDQAGQQLVKHTLEIESISTDLDELYNKVYQGNGTSSDLARVLAKLNEEYEVQMKKWMEWVESIQRRVSKLEECDEEEWVDGDYEL